MLKQLSCFALASACALSTQAFDKTQVDLKKDFLGHGRFTIQKRNVQKAINSLSLHK